MLMWLSSSLFFENRSLVLLVGTIAYPVVIIRDFRGNPLDNTKLNLLDRRESKVSMDFAYRLNCSLWIFWIVVGSLFLSRTKWFLTRRGPVHDV